MKLGSETPSPTELTIITNLCCLDWEFKTTHTGYYTHRCHTYSAKYIPQIPNLLISNFKTTIIEKSSRDQISEFLVSLRDDILHLRSSITVSGFKEKILDMDH